MKDDCSAQKWWPFFNSQQNFFFNLIPCPPLWGWWCQARLFYVDQSISCNSWQKRFFNWTPNPHWVEGLWTWYFSVSLYISLNSKQHLFRKFTPRPHFRGVMQPESQRGLCATSVQPPSLAGCERSATPSQMGLAACSPVRYPSQMG